MVAVHHLGFVWGHILTTCEEYLVISFNVHNSVAIDEVVLIIWRSQYLACLAGKMPFMPPKLWFWGIWYWHNISETTNRHILEWVHVIWPIERENPFIGLTCCRWVPKKRVQKYLLYFTYLPRISHTRISTKFCTVQVTDFITCDKFSGDWLRGINSVGDQKSPVSTIKTVAVNTCLAWLRSPWRVVKEFWWWCIAGSRWGDISCDT